MKNKITDAAFTVSELVASLEKKPDLAKLEQLSFITEGALDSLQKLAAVGNKAAAIYLVKALEKSINQLYVIHPKQLDTFSKMARKRNRWPGFIAVEKDWKKLNTEAAQELQLGADVSRNYKGKQWSRENNPAVQVADLLQTELHRRNQVFGIGLPPFNRQTSKQWFNAAKPLIVERYGKEFQDHKTFAPLLLNVKSIAEKNKKRNFNDSVFRSLILDRIEQAFKSIAPK
jgi:hypothetical protein